MHDITFRSDMKVTLIDHMGDDLFIARAAWEDWEREPMTDRHLPGMLDTMTSELHGSPFEFGAVVFHIECPLFVVAQFQRHRIGFSYAQRSARYKKMLPHFYVPGHSRPLFNAGTKMKPVLIHEPADRPEYLDDVDWTMCLIEEGKYIDGNFRSPAWTAWGAYQKLLASGVAEEIARVVLPVSTYTGFSVQMNPRSLMNFLQLRIANDQNRYPTHPQYEIERVAEQIEAHFKELWPLTWEAWNANGRVAS